MSIPPELIATLIIAAGSGAFAAYKYVTNRKDTKRNELTTARITQLNLQKEIDASVQQAERALREELREDASRLRKAIAVFEEEQTTLYGKIKKFTAAEIDYEATIARQKAQIIELEEDAKYTDTKIKELALTVLNNETEIVRLKEQITVLNTELNRYRGLTNLKLLEAYNEPEET